MSLYILILYDITIYVVYHIFMNFPLWLAVGPQEDYSHFFNVCSFYYTAVAVSGTVERSYPGLNTPVG